jgi:transposase InsO family protein
LLHRRTDIGSPEANGFCERFHRTVKEEFYAVAFRKIFYESLEQLQRDLDPYLAFYNRERPPWLSHPGPHAVSDLVRRGRTNAPSGG